MTGFKRPLVEEDIWELQQDNSANTIIANCETEWAKELDKWEKYVLNI